MRLLLALVAAGAAVASAGAGGSGPSTVVIDLFALPPAPQDVLAVQVCAGLANRAAPQSAYVLLHAEDATWLALTRPDLPVPPPLTPAADFVGACLGLAVVGGAGSGGAPPAAAGRLRYSWAQQQLVVPQLLTLAACLGAVPLEDASPFAARAALVFDAEAEWRNYSSLNATAAAFARCGAATATMAIMNPGLDVHGQPWSPSPPLSKQPDLSLADFVVSALLFNFWMTSACVPGTDENALLEQMVAGAPWPRPIAVYGYNDAYPVAGDIFEAETGCTRERSMGQVATVGVTNLAYFSGAPAVTRPLAQTAAPRRIFNASRTYVTFVVGDGDNIAFVKTSRLDSFRRRLAACGANASGAAAAPASCYPLAWTLSPRLLRVAPDIVRWFFANALTTHADFFVLPPSGALYAYPSAMPPDVQAAFVAATEDEAALMNASATVAWEVMTTWPSAIASYFPRYAARGVVRSFFALNVPYMVPVVEFSEGEFFKVLGNGSTPAVLFRPFEWRGTDGSTLLAPFSLNATAMASLINGYAPGTVMHIYLTTDGGCTIESCFDVLAPQLAEHVEIVPPGVLADLALQSRGL